MLLGEVSSLETRLQPSRENTNWKPKSTSARRPSGGWHSPQTWPIRIMHAGIDSLVPHIRVIIYCYGIRGVGACVCVCVCMCVCVCLCVCVCYQAEGNGAGEGFKADLVLTSDWLCFMMLRCYLYTAAGSWLSKLFVVFCVH